VIGETVWASTKSLFSTAPILLVAAVLGAVHDWQALWTLPVVFLTGLCFGSLALVITAFANNYDFFMYYYTLILTPMLLICGVFFPLEQMPDAIIWGAWLLPLTHAVELIRPLMTEAPLQQPLLHLAVLTGYAIGGTVLAIGLIRRRLTA